MSTELQPTDKDLITRYLEEYLETGKCGSVMESTVDFIPRLAALRRELSDLREKLGVAEQERLKLSKILQRAYQYHLGHLGEQGQRKLGFDLATHWCDSIQSRTREEETDSATIRAKSEREGL